MIGEWLSNIDSGNVTGLIYVDLRKAFDTVNHRIMIHKHHVPVDVSKNLVVGSWTFELH